MEFLKVLLEGVAGLPDRDRDPRISGNILELGSVYLGVEDDVLVIAIDPHHVGLGLSRREQRRQSCEIGALAERPYLFFEHGVSLR